MMEQQPKLQDITPIKRPKKTLKIVLIILISLLALLAAIAATYLLTKGKFQSQGPTKITVPNTSENKEEEGEFVYVTSKSGLNLRADASTSAEIVYTLPYRAKVKVEKKSKDEKWYKGTFEGENGWLSADYTQKEEPEDLTANWQDFESSASGYSLKFPADWKKKSEIPQGFDLQIISQDVGGVSISVQVKDGQTLDKERAGLTDAEHNIAGEQLIVVNGIKGKKIVTQRVKNSKVVYTTDVILLEKDGKLLRIDGPADGEDFGDVFNILVWTIRFNKS